MSDFLSILFVVGFYILVIVNGNQKKKTPNAKRRALHTRKAVFEQNLEDVLKESAQTPLIEEANIQENKETCDRSRMHLHQVTQQQFRESAEGEDPCHRGNAVAAESIHDEEMFSYDEQEIQQSGMVQDILRGVVMSEILMRPSERKVIRRNGLSMS